MDSKRIGIFVLLFTVVVALQEKCSLDKVITCMKGVRDVQNLYSSGSIDDICGKVRSVANCLTVNAGNCITSHSELDLLIEKSLKEMNEKLDQACPDPFGNKERPVGDPDDDEDPDGCIADHTEHLLKCVKKLKTARKALLSVAMQTDTKYLKCVMYSMVYHCVLDSAENTCGETGRQRVKEEFTNIADVITKSCLAEEDDTTDFFDFLM